MINHYSREFTIRVSCFGNPVVYTRQAIPGSIPGIWQWSSWRVINDSERNAVIVKLMELNK